MDQAGDQAGSAFHAHTMSVFLFDCERHALSSHVLSSKAWPTAVRALALTVECCPIETSRSVATILRFPLLNAMVGCPWGINWALGAQVGVEAHRCARPRRAVVMVLQREAFRLLPLLEPPHGVLQLLATA